MFYKLLHNASTQHKAVFGEFLIWATIVGWPVTATTVAQDEQQYILGLSWLAILLTGIDILINLQTHDKVT